jgi:hypothetical protein
MRSIPIPVVIGAIRAAIGDFGLRPWIGSARSEQPVTHSAMFYHGNPAAAADEAAGGPTATRNFFIGLTRVLRLPWPYSVGDVADRLYHDDSSTGRRHYAVPRLGAERGWDFARALFGVVDDAHLDAAAAKQRREREGEPRALAGRVAFGPAFAEGSPRISVEKRGVFGTPRESYYPFYLARAANASGNGTQRYDDRDAIPAGRKRYVVRRRTCRRATKTKER